MSYISILKINDHQYITIDHTDRTIEFLSYGVGPVIRIRDNKSIVFKLNKNDISTCNTEFLYQYLKTSPKTAASLFTRFIYKFVNVNIDAVTRSAFYNAFNDNIPAFVEFFNGCSSETRQQIIYDHICFNHDAKMNGIISLSTYVGNNTFCLARCNNCNNAICKYCYAAALTGQRYYLKMKLIRIMAILTTVELSKSDIPVIPENEYKYFRFESFGDLNNKLQFKNYNLIAAVNPDINFTIWTKNPGIIQAAINVGLQLSNNLVIGLSSLYLNTPELDKARKYSFIRFLFTVYDDEYIKNIILLSIAALNTVYHAVFVTNIYMNTIPGCISSMKEKNKRETVKTMDIIIILWASVFFLGMPAFDLIFRIFKIL